MFVTTFNTDALLDGAVACVKKAMWTQTLSPDQYSAAVFVANAVVRGEGGEDAYSFYVERAKRPEMRKHSPIQKRKFLDVHKELSKVENRHHVNILVATGADLVVTA